MKNYPNWLVHKQKVPYSPITQQKANTVDKCTDFATAIKVLEHGGYDGLGFHFDNTPFTGIDIDHCIDEAGLYSEMAVCVISDAWSYTELSPSGRGIHIYVKGQLPASMKNSKIGLEMYSQGRYFTVTGNKIPSSPDEILDRQKALDSLYCEYKSEAGIVKVTQEDIPPIEGIGEHEKTEIEQLVNRCLASRNGEKFRALYYGGDTAIYGGDDSRADLGLMCILAYFSNCNRSLMHDTFCYSKLAERDKWQCGNTGNNPMYYRTLTIEKAVQFTIGKQEERDKKLISSFYDGLTVKE